MIRTLQDGLHDARRDAVRVRDGYAAETDVDDGLPVLASLGHPREQIRRRNPVQIGII